MLPPTSRRRRGTRVQDDDSKRSASPRPIETLRLTRKRWLVTGAAGFIGSNLVAALLELDQDVVGLDNFATGYRENISGLAQSGSSRFTMIEGDIENLDTCRAACEGVSYVLHQAALGSVPRSLADPIRTNGSNVTGFLNMLVAARDAKVERFVYAASSSTYGDETSLPKVESRIGRPLSPYAVTKYVNELYADVFQRSYGIECIGLRYFNVFGRRQDPAGAYSAVIPRWIGRLLAGERCQIYGDGETSRDFTYIDNVLQANILAATAPAAATNEVYNVASGERTTLNSLFRMIRDGLIQIVGSLDQPEPEYCPPRSGDIAHSHADISKARERLGYNPEYDVARGLALTLAWFAGEPALLSRR